MSATVYGILRVSTATPEQIKTIIKSEPVKASDFTYDGEKLYEVLMRDFEWKDPEGEDDSVTIWREEEHNLIPVDTPFGPAFLFICWNEEIGEPISAVLLAR